MTKLERLADWLSGGALTRARWVALRGENFAEKLWKAEDTLRAIAAMETPGANATVRRMARIAREAMD